MSDGPRGDEPEDEYDEAEEPRSIFASLWFRAVLVVGVIGVAGVVAMPYVLDWTHPPASPPKPPPQAGARVTPPPAASSTMPAPSPGPSPSSAVVAEPKVAPPAVTPAVRSSAPSAADKAAFAEKQALAEKREALTRPVDKPIGKPVDKTMSAEKKSAVATSAAPKATSPSKERARVAPAKAVVSGGARAGSYWVQVGAYKEAAAAARVAARLREQGYHVEEVHPVERGSAPAPPAVPPPVTPASDKYEVLVSGAPVTALNERLGAKGLAAEPTASGVRVKPPLPLRDAIALSKDLAIDGLKVQVRRETGPEAAPVKSVAAEPMGGEDGWHRVRVGAFPDRGAARAAVRELSAKGYQGFVTGGTP